MESVYHYTMRLKQLLLTLCLMATVISVSAASSKYYEDAAERFSKGDFTGALIQLRNVLRDEPMDVAARFLLGRIYLKMGAARAAEEEFKRARLAGAAEDLLVIPISRAYLLQGKYAELFKNTRVVGRPIPVMVALLNIQGEAKTEMHELEDAAKMFARAEKLQPGNVDTMLGQSRLLLYKGDVAQAEDLADRALDANMDSHAVWYVKGDIRRIQQDFVTAIDYYSKGIALDKHHLPAYLGRAAAYLELKQDDKARKDLEYVRSINPEEPRAGYLYALLLTRSGELREARQLLTKLRTTLIGLGESRINDHAPSLLISAVVNYAQQQYKDAYNQLLRYRELVPHDKNASVLLASIMLRLDKPKAVIRTLTPFLQQGTLDPQVFVVAGQAFNRLKQFKQAADMFEQAVRLAPELADLRLHLGLSRLAIGAEEDAIADLRKALSMEPDNTKPGVMLGIVYLKQGELDKALTVANQLVSSQPEEPAGYNLLGAIHMSKKQFEQADEYFAQALSKDEKFMPALINMARLALEQKKMKLAYERFQDILKREPGNTLALDEMAKIAQADGRIETAVELLEKYRAYAPDQLQQQIRLALLYLRQGQIKEASQVARTLEQRFSTNLAVLELMGKIFIAESKLDSAMAVFQRMTRLAGFSTSALFGIAQHQLSIGDLAGARWSLQKAVTSKPDFVQGHAALVELDLRMDNLDEARERVSTLLNEYPNDVIVHLLNGDLKVKQEQYTEAIEAYQDALAIKPLPSLAVRYYRTLQLLGQLSEGIRFLEQWMDKYPAHHEVARKLASAYIHSGQTYRAITYHEHLLAAHENDSELLNNLALLYLKTNDTRATEVASRAYQLAPNEAATLDTYGWVLVTTGENQQGLKLLREAAVRAAAEPVVQYHLAVALFKMSRIPEARRYLREAISSGKDFNGLEQARKLLQDLERM